jgi:lipopolysaccharide transport system permease protein
MSVAAHDTAGAITAGSALPRRPSWVLSVFLDSALGVGAYLASYWLRFPGATLEMFLPAAWATTPIVVIAQLAALALAGAYTPRPRVGWLSRVIAGVLAGTAASMILVGVTLGFYGISRIAFAADALLMSIAALAWRGAWVLSSRARTRVSPSLPGDLVDRTLETGSVGAIVTSLFSYRELLKNLVIKDLKLKYRGSIFGFLWSMLNPLMMIIVYAVAFTYILRIRTAGFVFYLMLGQLAWTFFASSATMSTGAIIDNRGLVKSVSFPRAILPIATVMFNLAQYVLTVSIFLPVMLIWYQVPLAPPMLLFPVVLALQSMFTIGIALMLATATVFFRDVRHLLEVSLSVLFWTTPIVYELAHVPEQLRLLILLSPMSSFVVAYHKLFYYREWPDPSLWLVAGTYAVGAFLIGVTLVLAFEDRFSEQI